MANWGKGYCDGCADVLTKIQFFQGTWSKHLTEEQSEIVVNPNKAADGGLSRYAVANIVCGRVDAHNGNCRGKRKGVIN